MKCASCGRENPPDSAFCGGCGGKLGAPASGRQPTWLVPVLIIAVVVLLGVSAASIYRLGRSGGGEDTAKVSVTVDGRTVEVEKTVRREADLSDEYASDTIRGRVTDTGWRKFVVKSLDTGKVYIIHVGRSTRYSPRRHPKVGETVRATYHLRRGSVIGDRIDIE